MRIAAVPVLLALASACLVLPELPVLTGGEIVTGPEAEQLARAAGVRPFYRTTMPMGIANAVEVRPGVFLTVEHVIPRDDVLVSLGAQSVPAKILARGSTGSSDSGWVAVEMKHDDPTPTTFKPAGSHEVGQEVAVVGYWLPREGQPVIVRGRILAVPRGLEEHCEGFVPLDLGADRSYAGLSGSSVLVRDEQSGTWKQLGLYSGTASVDPGNVHLFNLALHLPELPHLATYEPDALAGQR